MPRVLVVDDNAVVRLGVATLLEASEHVEVVATAGNGADAVAEAARTRPDVVLLDVRMPVQDGLTAAAELSRHARVLMLTYADDEATIDAALRAGASGYLVHGQFTPDELVQAIIATHAGKIVLSPGVTATLIRRLRGTPVPSAPVEDLSLREREVMQCIAKGFANKEIAGKLVVSEKTVKNHVNRIYAKLGVTSRAAAIARWLGTADDRPESRMAQRGAGMSGPIGPTELGPRVGSAGSVRISAGHLAWTARGSRQGKGESR